MDDVNEDMFSGVPPTEPSASQRNGAREIRSMFLAFVEQGFTEAQALQIVGHMMAIGYRPPESS